MTTPGLFARSGVVVIVAGILIGPLVSHADYSSVAHTTSELAGQNMPHAWIMRVGFIAFGLGTLVAAVQTFATAPLERLALIVFGAGLIGAGVFPHVHIDPAYGGDLRLDGLHSIAASTVGAGFAATMAARLFIPGGNVRDWLSWAGLVASVAIPLAMVAFPQIDGALQRAMFAISFVWVWRAFPGGQARLTITDPTE